MDSPRISDSEGHAVFEAHGGISPYLDRVNSVLNTINEGYAVHQLFVGELVDHGLLETVALDIELNDGELDDARWFTRDDLRSDFPKLPFRISIARRLVDDWIGLEDSP